MGHAHPTESLDDLLAEEGPLESGTRRVADSGEVRRESQRPTFRVSAASGPAARLEEPRGIESGLDDDLPRSEESLAEMLAQLEQEPTVEVAPPENLPEPPAVEAKPTRSTLLPPALDRHPVAIPAPPVAIVEAPVARGHTLRVRLTPYAREHAVADAGTDDTPAEMLRYAKLLGSFDRLPHVTATMHEVMMAKLDHREGFVLSLVDGASDIDTILDACPMPTHKTLRILHGLYVRGIVGLR